MMTRIRMIYSAALLMACGGGAPKECKLEDANSCPTGQVCAKGVTFATPLCMAPVEVRGKVVELSDPGKGIAGAQVLAVSESGEPLTDVVTSGSDGAYTLQVPSIRTDDKGTPSAIKVTLRAAAGNYQPFPAGIRVSLPVDLGAASKGEKDQAFVVTGGASTIALIGLPDAEKNRPAIRGTIQLPQLAKGGLVVAEAGGGGFSAVPDKSGAFTIFNVAPGSYSVRGYVFNTNYTPASVTVASGSDRTGVMLTPSNVMAGAVSGTASLVAGGAGATSVVMVVESTFNQSLGRGEAPPGLRAVPDASSGAFTISGVPDGKYVILAAFENDTLVRDPDPNIGGTTTQHVTVTNGIADLTPAFKITGAITIVSPGASDSLDEVMGAPTFVWKTYSSAKTYEVSVFDAFGVQQGSTQVVNAQGISGDPQVTYAGPALAPGIYLWRVIAKGNAGNPISCSEDLRGIFAVKG